MRTRQRFVSTFLTMLLLASPALAATPSAFAPLADAIRQFKADTVYPTGTAVVVVKDGKVAYEGYFGYADIAGKVPVDRDTAFYIASATKPFVALHALLGEHAGTLDTGLSLQAMFPDARFDGFGAGAVTLRDLLVHTSGVENVPLVWATAYSGVHDAASRRRLAAATQAHPEATRGTFEYANVGYNLYSIWLDGRGDAPWQAQLQGDVFAPLGMRRTTASVSHAESRGWTLARPYAFAAADRDAPLYLAKADQTMHAAGGLLSTAPDLARFLIAELDDGRVDGKQILPASVIARSHQRQAVSDDRYLDFPRDGYAWGWHAGAYKGRRMLHHFGSFPGFHAHLSFIPEADVGLVVLHNEDMLGARLANAIADIAYGIALGEPGIEAKASARFGELAQQARKLEAAAGAHRQDIASRPWLLSLPRAAYAGLYGHPLLGDITISLEGDQALAFRWGRLAATATGYAEQDHVRVELVPNSGNVVAFGLQHGAVATLRLDGMTFSKR
jgi:CubicO group peptidase (beta-lactamase class C family)